MISEDIFIKTATEKTFHHSLLTQLIKSYLTEFSLCGNGQILSDYHSAIFTLYSNCNMFFQKKLDQIQNLFLQNWGYAFQFSYKQGIYVFLRNHFIRAFEENCLQHYVYDKIVKCPSLYEHKDFYHRANTINKLSLDMEQQLDDLSKFHLTSVAVAWEECIHAALRYGFYYGLKYGESIINQNCSISAQEYSSLHSIMDSLNIQGLDEDI